MRSYCDIAYIYASIRKMSRRVVVALQRLNNKCREASIRDYAISSRRCAKLAMHFTAVLPSVVIDAHTSVCVCVCVMSPPYVSWNISSSSFRTVSLHNDSRVAAQSSPDFSDHLGDDVARRAIVSTIRAHAHMEHQFACNASAIAAICRSLRDGFTRREIARELKSTA